MEQDMATIQAQLAQLTAQLTHNAERSSMQSVPTYGGQHHSNSMWWEAQQVPHEANWQPYEEFYSKPMQPQPHMQYSQSNSGSSIDYNQILNELNSLVQGSQDQAKETHQGEYWQPYEEFCQWPYEPPQPPPQPSHPNSDRSNYYKEVSQQLNSLEQGREAQPFQQDAFWQPIEDFYQAKEFAEWNNQFGQNAECMEQIQEQMVEDKPVDELLLLEEEEDAQDTAREEQPLPQLLNEEKVVEDHLEFIKEEIGVDHTATIITCNLAKFKIPETFEEVIFVIEFVSENECKPSSPILILFYTNLLILMIQAPTREFKPLPDHFKYHCPFKDKAMHLNKEGKPRNHPQSDLHS